MDTVAQCLAVVRQQLDQDHIKYHVSMTDPKRNGANLNTDCLYVIRQRIDADGVYQLTVAASMGQEKC